MVLMIVKDRRWDEWEKPTISKGENNNLKGEALLATIDLPIQLSPCDRPGFQERSSRPDMKARWPHPSSATSAPRSSAST